MFRVASYLLLITWCPVVALAKPLITSAILQISLHHGGCDGGAVSAQKLVTIEATLEISMSHDE